MLRDRRIVPALLPFALGLLSCNAVSRGAAEEAALIATALALESGQSVADVGAGNGLWSEHLARAVGRAGRVFASEVDADEIGEMRRRFERGKLHQVTVVEGDQEETGLPESCCDAILLRMVYHHFEQPSKMRSSLERALKPGGLLLVVDIAPQTSWRELPGVPERGGHGIAVDELIADLTGDGFVVLERYPDWPGEKDRYAVLFRLP